MLVLTPRVYGQNTSIDLRTQNKITSVTMPVMQNTILDPLVVSTQSFVNAEIDNATYVLPVPDDIKSTYYRCVYNSFARPLFATYNFAKSRVECLMAKGERTFELSQPIEGIPRATLRFYGRSYTIDRGSGAFDDFPTNDALLDEHFDVSGWIRTNATQLKSNLSENYSTRVNMTPWINQFIARPGAPTPADIRTTWSKPSGGGDVYAYFESWKNSGNIYVGDADFMNAIDGEGAAGADPAKYQMPRLYIGTSQIYPTVRILKISTLTYKIEWWAPVRVAYIAASRGRSLFGNTIEVDNYAFLDEITQIDIDIVASKRDTSFEDITTHLENVDANFNYFYGPGTDKFNLELAQSESTTKDTTITYPSGSEWVLSQVLPTMLIGANAEGKLYAQIDVPATWVLRNNVDIGTEMQVQQIDGGYVTRDGVTVCTFRVQNMVLRKSMQAITYTLQLLEV